MEDKILIRANESSTTYLKAADWRLGCLINYIGDIECNTHPNGYEFLVGEVVGQMLSNKVAGTIYNRLVESCEGMVTPQNVIDLSASGLRAVGISRSKSQCIINISEMILDGSLCIEELYEKTDNEIHEILTSIKGIGTWTAKMFLLFAKQSQDILPYEDGAFLQTYKWLYSTSDVTPASVKKNCKSWSPYASVASRYFYRALDMKITENNVELIFERNE